MKRYKIKALEQEQWERHYIIEANSKEEAEDKAINGNLEDNDKLVSQERYNFEADVDEIYEVKE